MTDNEIKPGSLVKLKSYGPIMTVSEVYEVEPGVKKATCVWFADKDSTPTEHGFRISTLELAPGLLQP